MDVTPDQLRFLVAAVLLAAAVGWLSAGARLALAVWKMPESLPKGTRPIRLRLAAAASVPGWVVGVAGLVLL